MSNEKTGHIETSPRDASSRRADKPAHIPHSLLTAKHDRFVMFELDDDPAGGGEPADPNPPAPPADPPNAPPAPPKTDAEAKRLDAELKKAQKELERLRALEKEREDAQLSELEKTKRHLEETQAQLAKQNERNERLLKESALRRAAAERGAKRPDAILKLVDWERVEISAEGGVTGLDEVLDDVEGDVPELFEKPGDKSTSNPSSGGGKQSDRGNADDGYETGYDVGRAIAKRLKTRKNDTRL